VPDASAPYPVVVLAGGLGTRMEAVTPGPKALVPVSGEPFAFHQLRLLASQGVRDVVYVIGHQGAELRERIDDGSEFALSVTYVDEGSELHGTGGALRVALDQGVLPEVFGVLYGDSYLPIDLAPIWAAFVSSGRPALMTVIRNADRWDRSNAVFHGGLVIGYDKRPERRRPEMQWIDYGFSVVARAVVEGIPAGAVVDLGDVFRALSLRGDLAGYEVLERFYEVGSPDGLADLERHLEGR
jgi:NDP-sugar pyrophosphorylase family protein